MTVRCPQCATIAPLSAEDVGAEGAMVRCKACGTRWLARVFEEDPYARKPIQRMAAADIIDALVIEHAGPGFERAAIRTRLPVPTPVSAKRDWRAWKIGGIVLGALVAIVLLRSPILAALPGGLPDEVSALEFTSIRSQTVHQRNGSTFIVEGEIINRSATDIALPAIRITLRSPSGDPVSSWLVEPAVAGLGPGKSIGFRSALASPPPDAAQVTLDLAAREGI